MSYVPVSGLPMIEEAKAEGEVAELYATIRRETQQPYVPNMSRALASSPGALAFHSNITRLFYEHISLPQSLSTMVLFAIAKSSNCTYCSTAFELGCRSIGYDEALLEAVIEDLGNVRPERLQAIVDFALKASHNPQGLVEDDYEKVREQGIEDGELAEIIVVVSLAKYLDTLADALKVEVDNPILEGLAQFNR